MMKEEVHVSANVDELSVTLARLVMQASTTSINKHGDLWIALSGGSLLDFLAKELPLDHADYVHWKIAWVDERLVDVTSADSNCGVALEKIFKPRHIQMHQIFSILFTTHHRDDDDDDASSSCLVKDQKNVDAVA